MKKAFDTILKLLLVLTIFLGLQGKVIVRYAEIFHKNTKNEITHTGMKRVKASIIQCKLQCYTRYFQVLDAPVATLLLILSAAVLVTDLLYIPFKEKLSIAGSVRLLPLRAPPAF